MDKKAKRERQRVKRKKHLSLMKNHEAIRMEAEDAFNLANYKIHLHSNPDQHAQMKEESDS
jgi:hypothetical protein